MKVTFFLYVPYSWFKGDRLFVLLGKTITWSVDAPSDAAGVTKIFGSETVFRNVPNFRSPKLSNNGFTLSMLIGRLFCFWVDLRRLISGFPRIIPPSLSFLWLVLSALKTSLFVEILFSIVGGKSMCQGKHCKLKRHRS